MTFKEIPKVISKICSDDSTDFKKRTATLFSILKGFSHEDLIAHIEYGGVIPESFSHDSSEEKLFAKYCDFLLARGFTILGILSTVIEERGDAADVIGAGEGYTIVGDAKAFRLSRTAKNQKDFKIEALNQWKKKANYACLLAPLYQYPTKASQIYAQAIRYNVTLLSFTHLGFLLRADSIKPRKLKALWEVGESLKSGKDAVAYWNAISHHVAQIADLHISEWDSYLEKSKKFVLEQAQHQLFFWHSEKLRIKNLSHEEAVSQLIASLRIESNINSITNTIQRLEEFVNKLD